MAETTRKLSIQEELVLAEQQTPGHKASRGPGNTIVMTPIPEYYEELRAQRTTTALAQTSELALSVEESAA